MIFKDPITGLQRSIEDKYDPNADRSNQTTTGYTFGGKNYTYQTRTDASGNPYQVDVPTTAPTGEVSKKSATPVVSGATAVDDYNNRVVPGMKEAVANLQKSQQTAQTATDKTKTQEQPETPVTKPTSQTKTYMGGDGQFYSSPEEALTNTPDAGHIFAYGPNGQRAEVPLGTQLPMGYTDKNPAVSSGMAQPTDTVNLPDGTSVKQMSDGTYATYKEDGTFVGASNKGVYENAQKLNKAQKDLDDMANGTVPLRPEQQAIIDQMNSYLKMTNGLMSQQGAALAGGTALSQLAGNVSGASFAPGQMQQVISGASLDLAKANVQMLQQIGNMQIAFRSNNVQDLKNAYEAYSSAETSRQNLLKTTADRLNTIYDDAKKATDAANAATDNDIRQLMGYARGIATPEQLQAAQTALDNHDMAGAMKALGDSTRERSPAGKEYDDYVASARKAGVTPMGWNEYQTADANRKARVAAAGAARLGGSSYTKDQERVIDTINTTIADSPVYKRVEATKNFADGVKDSLDQETGPGDIAAINQYQKVIDEGAVTRDQDVKLVQSAQTIGGQLQTWLKGRGATGEKLSPELRQQLRDTVDALYQGKVKALMNSPYIESQKKKASRVQVDINDTIVGSLSNFNDTAAPTVGDEHIQTATEAQDALKTAAKSDSALATQIHAALLKEPDPIKVYNALKARGKI